MNPESEEGLTASEHIEPGVLAATRRTLSATREFGEGWYVVELVERALHRDGPRYGYVLPVTIGGTAFFRVAEPWHVVDAGPDEDGERMYVPVPERVTLYAAAAIYSLVPSSRDKVLGLLAERDAGFPF